MFIIIIMASPLPSRPGTTMHAQSPKAQAHNTQNTSSDKSLHNRHAHFPREKHKLGGFPTSEFGVDYLDFLD